MELEGRDKAAQVGKYAHGVIIVVDSCFVKCYDVFSKCPAAFVTFASTFVTFVAFVTFASTFVTFVAFVTFVRMLSLSRGGICKGNPFL